MEKKNLYTTKTNKTKRIKSDKKLLCICIQKPPHSDFRFYVLPLGIHIYLSKFVLKNVE